MLSLCEKDILEYESQFHSLHPKPKFGISLVSKSPVEHGLDFIPVTISVLDIEFPSPSQDSK
jgi:hypothetical protein